MSTPENGLVQVDFLSHAETVIAAPAETIWPAIVDPNPWHGSQLISVGGPKGEVGERFHGVDPANPEVVQLYVQNAEMVPHRRRTIRITFGDGTYSGYSTWTLKPKGSETIATYEIFCLYAMPAEAAAGAAAIAQAGAEASLKLLKEYVENLPG
jgi:uncharacterized protein YndB with AHSA1/START domain